MSEIRNLVLVPGLRNAELDAKREFEIDGEHYSIGLRGTTVVLGYEKYVKAIHLEDLVGMMISYDCGLLAYEDEVM